MSWWKFWCWTKVIVSVRWWNKFAILKIRSWKVENQIENLNILIWMRELILIGVDLKTFKMSTRKRKQKTIAWGDLDGHNIRKTFGWKVNTQSDGYFPGPRQSRFSVVQLLFPNTLIIIHIHFFFFWYDNGCLIFFLVTDFIGTVSAPRRWVNFTLCSLSEPYTHVVTIRCLRYS